MKKTIYLGTLTILVSLLTNCATIVGGSKYYAKVQVTNDPNAKIEYNGGYKGTGEATFKVKRKDANKFTVTIKEDGCETETKKFTQKSFRGWAFAGTVVGWTGVIPTAPYILPWGVAVDGITGAWWKPDINEKGVSKQDYKHYIYQVRYNGCKKTEKNNSTNNENPNKSKADKLRELKKLYLEEILTKEEYEKEKKKILEEK